MVKKFIQAYIRFVQKILVTVFLAVLYVFGIGITALVSLFVRGDAGHSGEVRGKNFWIEPRGRDAGFENAKKPF